MRAPRYEPLTALTRDEILDDLEKIAAKLLYFWDDYDTGAKIEHDRALDWLHDLLSENGR